MQSTTRFLVTAAVLAAALSSRAAAADWITAPSYYTHDPQTGKRVTQYSPIGPVYIFSRPDYIRSGYRHWESNLRVGGSADRFHVVEEWGRPVRPYGEWRFPYRPYSVPYGLWGPPFAGMGYPYPYPYPPYPTPYPYGGAQPYAAPYGGPAGPPMPRQPAPGQPGGHRLRR